MIYLLGTTDFTKKVNPYFKEFSDCRGSAFVLSQEDKEEKTPLSVKYDDKSGGISQNCLAEGHWLSFSEA